MRLAATALAAGAIAGGALAQEATASTWWHSPDKNIACSYWRGSVDCQTQNNLRVVILRHEGRATVGTGIHVGAPGRVLRYGRSIRKGGFVCTSRRSGMTCRSTVSGHGFRIWAGGWRRTRGPAD